MSGEELQEEERVFLAAREELVDALRRDPGQTFSPKQLLGLLDNSLPLATRYPRLDASCLVCSNAQGEVSEHYDWQYV